MHIKTKKVHMMSSFSKYISKKKCIYGNYDKYEQFLILWLWQQGKRMHRRQEGHRNLQMVQVLLKHFQSRTNKRDYMSFQQNHFSGCTLWPRLSFAQLP